MKKSKLIAALLVFLCVMTLSVQASAKDMSRRFGVGVDSSLSNFNGDDRGISVVYHVMKLFAIQAILGVNTTTYSYYTTQALADAKQDKASKTIIDWNASLRGMVPIGIATDVHLDVVIGFTASGRSMPSDKSDDNMTGGQTGYNLAIDIGLRPEWFVSDHFSIHTQVGLGVTILTGSSYCDPSAVACAGDNYEAMGANLDFFHNADFFGEAGFTFYF